MKNIEEFLDWLVRLDIAFYQTTSEPDYTPSGKSHFYLKGSPERFTSKEMIEIFTNEASEETNERWNYAIADSVDHKKHVNQN